MSTPYEYWRIEVQYSTGWVDVTSDVDTVARPIGSTTGSSPETTGDPAALSVALRNVGFKYTPGNTSSAFALTAGMPIRYSETIAGQTVYLFTGFVEFPEIETVNVSMAQDQTLMVSAVDQLSRWERSETFSSALGAYILSTPDLVGYWPLTDQAEPFHGLGPTASPMVVDMFRVSAIGAPDAQLEPAAGDAPPGGEGFAARFLTSSTGGSVGAYAQVSWPIDFEPPIAATDSVTVVMWIAVTGTTFATQVIASIIIQGSSTIGLLLSRDLTTGVWTLAASGAMTATVSAGAVGAGTLFPVGIRFTMSPASMELWIGGQRYVAAAPAGSPPTNPTLFQGNFGSLPIDYDLSHMQAYVGPTYSYTDFQTQIAQGYTPLQRQTTGDRIRTIARYAGKTDAELSQVDTGCSIMQRAQLAGLTVAQAMYEARDTEQGDLYIDGSGLLTFHDRRTILNI